MEPRMKRGILPLGLLLAMSALIFGGCGAEPKRPDVAQPEEIHIAAPAFDGDSAFSYIQKQVDFGPRVISSKGWKNCAIWLEKKFKNTI